MSELKVSHRYALSLLENSIEKKILDKVQGDIQVISRGQKVKKIRKLQRKRVSNNIISSINSSAYMHEANKLIGYPTNYKCDLLEPWWKPILSHLKRYIARKS